MSQVLEPEVGGSRDDLCALVRRFVALDRKILLRSELMDALDEHLAEAPAFRDSLLEATTIDRLNLGAVPTIQLNWLQPHEGNIIDFLFRARAFQEGSV